MEELYALLAEVRDMLFDKAVFIQRYGIEEYRKKEHLMILKISERLPVEYNAGKVLGDKKFTTRSLPYGSKVQEESTS